MPGSPCPAPNPKFHRCITFTTLGRLLTFWQRDHSVKPRLLSTPPNWRFTQIEKRRRNTSGSNLWESHDITGWSPGGLDSGWLGKLDQSGGSGAGLRTACLPSHGACRGAPRPYNIEQPSKSKAKLFHPSLWSMSWTPCFYYVYRLTLCTVSTNTLDDSIFQTLLITEP